MAGLTPGSSICLDTNCLVYLAEEPAESRGRKVAAVIAQAGGAIIAISTLALGEAMVGPLRKGRPELARAMRMAIQAIPGAILVAPALEIASVAAEIRARTGIKLIDAIHLATAESTGVSYFITNDRALAKLAGPTAEGRYLDELEMD